MTNEFKIYLICFFSLWAIMSQLFFFGLMTELIYHLSIITAATVSYLISKKKTFTV